MKLRIAIIVLCLAWLSTAPGMAQPNNELLYGRLDQASAQDGFRNHPESESLGARLGVKNPVDYIETQANRQQELVGFNGSSDDVTKTISTPYADQGEVLTYTITIAPNHTDADITYNLLDSLPAGVSYIAGSLTTTGSDTLATYDSFSRSMRWQGVKPKIETTYLVSDNLENSACQTPLGGYINLQDEGITPQAGVEGDNITMTFDAAIGTDFYGRLTSEPAIFSDDGVIVMGEAGLPVSYNNQNLPNPVQPNGLIAPFWRDMRVVYDNVFNKGVSIGQYDDYWVLEVDDSEDYYYATHKLDYEVIAYYEADLTGSRPDIIVAYDNVVGDWNATYGGEPIGTVGIENFDGDRGTTYAYDDWHPVSGRVVCFDAVLLNTEPIVITFDVSVDLGTPTRVENCVFWQAEGLESLEEEVCVPLGANAQPPIANSQKLSAWEGIPLNLTLTGSELTPGLVSWNMGSEPAHGVLSGTAPDLVYTSEEGFIGKDQFTFTVNDGVSESNLATVEISINPSLKIFMPLIQK